MKLEHGQPRSQDVATYGSDGRWVDGTFNDVLERLSSDIPERVAVIDQRGGLTYREYREQALRVAGLLLELGLQREDVIAVQLPNWREFAITTNGAGLVGVPFCQFHPGFRAKEVELVLGFTDAAAIVVPASFKGFDYPAMIAELMPRLPALRHIIVVGDSVPDGTVDLRRRIEDPHAAVPSPEALAARRPHGNDLMRVAFTSGTTGDPKAVIHTFNTSRGSLPSTVEAHKINAESVLMLFQPVGLNLGLQETYRALTAGANVVYLPSFDPQTVLETIERERVTHINAAPAAVISLLAQDNFDTFDLSSLYLVIVGGAPCPESLIREWGERASGHVIQTYGMLEMGSGTLMTYDDRLEDVATTVGRAHPAIELKIVDTSGDPVPAGIAGEILAKGPSVSLGYYRNPEANARAFTPDGWLHSGDVGFFDERGFLHVVGRTKEMIIRGGANIYPAEIEDVLMRHPSVRDCGVVGIPHPRLGEIAVAFVVLHEGTSLTFDEMATFVGKSIATYKVPERLELIDELPRTPTGKLRRPDLVESLAMTRG